MKSVQALRGATQVERDVPELIHLAVSELLSEMMLGNSLTVDNFISVLFTATPDLVSDFPAVGARSIGFGAIPLICASEIDVPNAMPRVIRVLAHVETDQPRSAAKHIYLNGAVGLRQDLAQ
ncbi:MAG TPA: chorismate mutase [Candidatus Nanopelagicaceae bacterium]|nr:chorismate mutase [Candidatus Nanopelagicaceae bacterium]